MTNFTKGGRPPLIDRCDHCVKVRFNNAEWDELTRMMERADMTVKATFIKQLIFGKPFKVLTTDKNRVMRKSPWKGLTKYPDTAVQIELQIPDAA